MANNTDISKKILRLMEYSFLERGDVIPYINLTDRERAIISEADYELIHDMIREEKLEIQSKISVWEIVKISVAVSFVTSFIVLMALC